MAKTVFRTTLYGDVAIDFCFKAAQKWQSAKTFVQQISHCQTGELA